MSAADGTVSIPRCYVHPDFMAGGFCVSCGRPICPDCIIEIGGKYRCVACMTQITEVAQSAQIPQTVIVQKRKNPVAAALLSLFIVGAGQLYNGQIWQGLVFLGIGIISIPLFPYSLVWMLPVSLFSILNASAAAKEINSGEFPGRPSSKHTAQFKK
ncbi:MAG: hypothetical protein WC935_01615 [Thermoleophilia bacterium]